MEVLLDQKEAAKRLGLSVKTLERWRWASRGPRFIKLSGRAVRYRPEDLSEWVEARAVETQCHG